MQVPMRLGPAELTLIEQLNARGATAEAARFAANGLPTRRVEAYHYTDLKQLLRVVPGLVAASPEAGAGPLALDGALRFGIANGRVQEFSALPQGIRAGKVAGGVLTTRDDVLVRLNGALCRESLSLEVDGVGHKVVLIDRRTVGAAGHDVSGAKIFVADDAEVTIVDVHSGSDAAHVVNHATYLAVGRGAKATHVTLNLMPGEASHFATLEYELSERAELRTLAVNAGGALARMQLFPRFAGGEATADITGLNLVGEGEVKDITMDALHAVPNTSSRPLFKSIARGRARAVVQGRLVVARDAQKTDAKMMAQGLMLTEDAEILCKPELEIYADDVVCGHGATCGQLDEDHLFYLMSRGIAQAEAETMLVRAFLAELIDPIADAGLAAALAGVVDGWLAADA